jgi:high affinity sulfate transporter 1
MSAQPDTSPPPPTSSTPRLEPRGLHGPARWLPGLVSLRRYKRGELRGDLVAGLAVTALLVPQGMAYAELAGLPAVTGLYTTILALLAYAVFGPSPILVLGPDSALAPMILAAILPLIGADGDPAKAIALASALAVLMGLMCVVAGFARLGVITELLSKPLRVGYINGIAVVVVVSQLPKLFGFSVEADATPARLWEFLVGVADGLTNWYALAIGACCLAILFAFRHWLPKFPGVLVAFVGATVVVAVLGLTANGVPVVGPVPGGFPTPALPSFPLGDLAELALAAFGMAFITLADTSALSRTFALKYDREVDPNQEIVALGAANMAAGFFQGFPVSASSSRTAVAEAAGGRSQLVGVVGAAAIVVLLLFAGGLTTYLPQASLAAIVIVAGTSLFDLKTMRWLWKVRRTELALCLAALFGVAVVGVLQGIVIAIVLSILTFLWQVWRPYDATLGRVRGRHGYHDIARNPEAEQIPGMVIYRFDAPIFFANAEHFARCVKRHIAEHGEPVRRVLIAGEPITDIDTTGVESLRDLLDDLAAEGITVVFAEVKGQVKDRLQRYGVFWDIGEENFYYTVDQAVAEYVLDIGEDPVGWVDDYSDAQPEEEREGPVPVEPGPTEQLGPPEPSEPTA